MQEKIDFLKIIDQPVLRDRHKSQPKHLQLIPPLTMPYLNKKRNPALQKFQYAKGIQFGEEKLGLFPQWLKGRTDFVDFIYQNYQKKILQLPKICEKPCSDRASDQLYFLSMYLATFPMFNKLPNIIQQIILRQLTVKYYKKGEVIHEAGNVVEFMGMIFLGEVEYDIEVRGINKTIKKSKNELVMNQCFYRESHPTVTAKEQTIIFILNRSVYRMIQNKLTSELSDTYREDIIEMTKSDFFTQLHIKDKKARNFMEDLTVQFFFKGQKICQCGQEPQKFYILLNGDVLRRNHIHIRQHNKWPLPNGRWEIRAVYKNYESDSKLEKYHFFCDQQILGNTNIKATYIAQSHTILLGMTKANFLKHIGTEDQKKLKKYRNEHMVINYQDFEKDIRRKRRDTDYKKKIIHQAIDVSYMNKSTLPELQRTKKRVEGYEKHMLNHVTDILQ